MSHIGNDTIIDNERDDQDEEHIGNCSCDECEGICGLGMCGQCAGCEELADNEKFWQANRADILGL